MVMYLRRANPVQIEALKTHPETVEAFVFPEEESEESESDLVEFDKAWHALHFTLTGELYGSGHPLGIIADDRPEACAGEQVFGGFWVIEPGEMKAFASSLAALSDDALAKRFDPEAMIAADVYLADAFADEGSEPLEYLMQGVPALRRFATICMENGEGAIRVLG